jgi:hypothetical protein
MRNLYALLLVVCAGLATAQVTPNSVTVTANRNTNLQPDQAVFGVNVTTPVDATRDDVIAALQGSGITLSNFTSVQSLQVPSGRVTNTALQWSFALPAPLANMKATLGLLSAVQNSMAKDKPAFMMSFGVNGLQVSPQAQQSQTCSLADLVNDARAQAQKLASAAGATVGAVMAISNATVVTDTGSTNPFAQPTLAPSCSLTVKFALSGGF